MVEALPILGVDAGGLPLRWLHWREAVNIYARELVLWETGGLAYRAHGGYNRVAGMQSVIDVQAIIALKGESGARLYASGEVRLNNPNLYLRDDFTCMYCGHRHHARELSRDHIIPRSRGGEDVWNNVVCACKKCNSHKGSYTPEEAAMPLLMTPYAPNHAEYLILAKRNVLGDQMELLKRFVPRARRQ